MNIGCFWLQIHPCIHPKTGLNRSLTGSEIFYKLPDRGPDFSKNWQNRNHGPSRTGPGPGPVLGPFRSWGLDLEALLRKELQCSTTYGSRKIRTSISPLAYHSTTTWMENRTGHLVDACEHPLMPNTRGPSQDRTSSLGVLKREKGGNVTNFT